MRWVLESAVFGSGFDLTSAAIAAGHRVTTWNDEWWRAGDWPTWGEEPTLFHGSLGNAARIADELPWRPGSFCQAARYPCSEWYPRAEPWLLNQGWQIMPASQLVANPPPFERVFVRPDSPLKPFSGRVLNRSKITLQALDFGYYYEDPDIPVVVAPVRLVGLEWRYVVVDKRVIAGSGYEPNGRLALREQPDAASWRFAQSVASHFEAPELGGTFAESSVENTAASSHRAVHAG